MTRRHRTLPSTQSNPAPPGYDAVYAGLVELLESARRAAARSVNAVITATHWEIGRRVIEYEQGGSERAGYGEGMRQGCQAPTWRAGATRASHLRSQPKQRAG